MNPMTNVRNITKLSERELKYGDGKTSWHDEYRDSAWLFIGGLPYDLTEGDVIAVFSQYGEIVNINLIRDKATGKSKGFAFLCYENQRSTVLAVDNFNNIKILGRTLRVDHVKEYKVPKDSDKVDDLTRELWKDGCAPTSKFGGAKDPNAPELLESDEEGYPRALPAALPSSSKSSKDKPEKSRGEKRKHGSSSKDRDAKKSKKSKKERKKKKKKHKKHSRKETSSDDDSSDSD